MIEPIGATLLAIPILDEDPSLTVLLGTPFILAGVWVALGVRAREPVAISAA